MIIVITRIVFLDGLEIRDIYIAIYINVILLVNYGQDIFLSDHYKNHKENLIQDGIHCFKHRIPELFG